MFVDDFGRNAPGTDTTLRFSGGKDLSVDEPAQTFQILKGLITPDLVKSIGAVYLFKISGLSTKQ